MGGANVYVAFSLWREWAEFLQSEEKSEEMSVAVGVKYWTTQSMLRAVLLWRRSLDSKLSGHNRMLDAEQVWRAREMDTIFVRWRDYTNLYLELLELMAQASFRFYHKSLSDVFQHWRSRETGQQSGRSYSISEQFGSPNADIVDPLDQGFEQHYRKAIL